MRGDGRPNDGLRPVRFDLAWAPRAEGSCLVTQGRTRVLCTASVEERLPPWREGGSAGWVTGEYGMLPRSTHTRTSRERTGARARTQEIERLIGRSLRSVTDLEALGPRTVTLDCDVLEADGGTRTAAITGAWLALALASRTLVREGRIARSPLARPVAAVSVGLVDGGVLLDLDYEEDVRAQVDMNVVAAEGGDLVEVQGTAEGAPFSRRELDLLLDMAAAGIASLHREQRRVLEEAEA